MGAGVSSSAAVGAGDDVVRACRGDCTALAHGGRELDAPGAALLAAARLGALSTHTQSAPRDSSRGQVAVTTAGTVVRLTIYRVYKSTG